MLLLVPVNEPQVPLTHPQTLSPGQVLQSPELSLGKGQ